MKTIFPLIFCLFSIQIVAQDTITTMGGRVIDCSIIDDLGIDIRFQVVKKNGKEKEMRLHRSEIFSVQKEGKGEEVYYAKDEILGDWLTIEEMRVFIQGEQDARENYEVKWVVVGGAVTGAAVAYLAQGALMMTLAGPIMYPLIQLIPMIRIKEETITDIRNQYDEVYALGYERVARPKRVIAGLKSAAAGMTVGILGWLVVPLDN